jgi:hypothetical protein
MAPMKGLREHLSDTLERCHHRGLVLPYFLVAIAINGSIVILRCADPDEGRDVEVLVSRLINEGWNCAWRSR